MGPSGSSKTTLLGLTLTDLHESIAKPFSCCVGYTCVACRMLTRFVPADVLAGRKTVGTITGKILFAGQHATKTFLRRYTGYVEQFGRNHYSAVA